MKNQRVFYWMVIVAILLLFSMLYEQYIDLEETLHRTNKVSSRQAQLTTRSWYDKVLTKNRKIGLLETQLVTVEERHAHKIIDLEWEIEKLRKQAKEMDEVVAFHTSRYCRWCIEKAERR